MPCCPPDAQRQKPTSSAAFIAVNMVARRSGLNPARVPVAKVDAGHAANGLDAALSKVLLDIVRWVSTGR